jgi:hypothetical protein
LLRKQLSALAKKNFTHLLFKSEDLQQQQNIGQA